MAAATCLLTRFIRKMTEKNRQRRETLRSAVLLWFNTRAVHYSCQNARVESLKRRRKKWSIKFFDRIEAEKRLFLPLERRTSPKKTTTLARSKPKNMQYTAQPQIAPNGYYHRSFYRGDRTETPPNRVRGERSEIHLLPVQGSPSRAKSPRR